MDLLQLQYFKKLAETEHLTNTASELMISPSSLSAMISRLERSLGTPLFDRVGRKIYLNNYGKIYLKYVNQVFRALENGEKELADARDEGDMHLTIGITTPTIWTDALRAFMEEYPAIRCKHTVLKLAQFSTQNALDPYDVVIAEQEDFQKGNWDYVPLELEEHPCVAVHRDHPLAEREQVHISELEKEYFYLPSMGYAARRYGDRFFQLAGFQPKVAFEYDYSVNVMAFDSTKRISILASSVRSSPKYRDYVFVDISGIDYRFDHAIGWDASCYHSKAARLFRSFILERQHSEAAAP